MRGLALGKGRPFLVAANVGHFLSSTSSGHRARHVFEPGCPGRQRLVAEGTSLIFFMGIWQAPGTRAGIVSNTVGEVDSPKKYTYAQIRINYYVIYDPLRQVMPDCQVVFCMHGATKWWRRPMCRVGHLN